MALNARDEDGWIEPSGVDCERRRTECSFVEATDSGKIRNVDSRVRDEQYRLVCVCVEELRFERGEDRLRTNLFKQVRGGGGGDRNPSSRVSITPLLDAVSHESLFARAFIKGFCPFKITGIVNN